MTKLLIDEAVVRQVLEALECESSAHIVNGRRIPLKLSDAISDITTVIKQMEDQEPVAWMYEYDGMVHDKLNPPLFSTKRIHMKEPWNETRLFTAEQMQHARADALREAAEFVGRNLYDSRGYEDELRRMAEEVSK